MYDAIFAHKYDVTGTLSSNLISDEIHKLTSAQGEDYMFIRPRKAPFLTKDINIIDVNTGKILRLDIDFVFKVEYETGSKNKAYYLIRVINKDYFDSVLKLTYRTIGGDTVYDSLAVMEYLVNLELGAKVVRWSDVLHKTGRYDSESHIHHIKDFGGFKNLYEAIDRSIVKLNEMTDEYVALLTEHIETPNAHNLTLLQMGLSNIKNMFPATMNVLSKDTLSPDEARMHITPDLLRQYTTANLQSIELDIANSIMGPKTVRQGETHTWTITDYDSFSDYRLISEVGSFTLDDDIITGVFYISDTIGNFNLTVVKNNVPTVYEIWVDGTGVMEPVITGVVDGADNVLSTLLIGVTGFTSIPQGVDTFESITYQVALNDDFTVLHFETTVTNLNQVQVTSLTAGTRYYLRAKFKGNLTSSGWSDVISFITVG